MVDRCRLADGQVFPLPITLDVPKEQFADIRSGDTLTLAYEGAPVAKLDVESKFYMTDADIEAVFRTGEDTHPGVRKERNVPPAGWVDRYASRNDPCWRTR